MRAGKRDEAEKSGENEEMSSYLFLPLSPFFCSMHLPLLSLSVSRSHSLSSLYRSLPHFSLNYDCSKTNRKRRRRKNIVEFESIHRSYWRRIQNDLNLPKSIMVQSEVQVHSYFLWKGSRPETLPGHHPLSWLLSGKGSHPETIKAAVPSPVRYPTKAL